jgi:hypothetical protein
MQNRFFRKKIQKSLCITTMSLYTNSNFKHNYLENYNDSEHAVKTKNAPFFMIFPNISFFHMVINYWTGPLKGEGVKVIAGYRHDEKTVFSNVLYDLFFSYIESVMGNPKMMTVLPENQVFVSKI